MIVNSGEEIGILLHDAKSPRLRTRSPEFANIVNKLQMLKDSAPGQGAALCTYCRRWRMKCQDIRRGPVVNKKSESAAVELICGLCCFLPVGRASVPAIRWARRSVD